MVLLFLASGLQGSDTTLRIVEPVVGGIDDSDRSVATPALGAEINFNTVGFVAGAIISIASLTAFMAESAA